MSSNPKNDRKSGEGQYVHRNDNDSLTWTEKLLLAVEDANSVKVQELLSKNNSPPTENLDRTLTGERNPLWIAAYDGQLQVAKLILSSTRKFHPWLEVRASEMYDQMTPLQVACMLGHIDMAILLTENGANLWSKSLSGYTSLDLLAGSSTPLDVEKKDHLNTLPVPAAENLPRLLFDTAVRAAMTTKTAPNQPVASVTPSDLNRVNEQQAILLQRHDARLNQLERDGWCAFAVTVILLIWGYCLLEAQRTMERSFKKKTHRRHRHSPSRRTTAAS